MQVIKKLSKLLIIAALVVVPMFSMKTEASASSSTGCFDMNGGFIGDDDFNVKEVQKAIGTKIDGKFGPASCSVLLSRLKSLGLLNNLSKSVWIDNTVLGWIGVIHPSVPSITATNGKNTCELRTTADVIDIQRAIGAFADGKFGPMSCLALRDAMVKKGLRRSSDTNFVFTDQTGRSLGVDNNAADRVPCRFWGKCILVDQVNGANQLTIFTDGAILDNTRVNTGKSGLRTRNGTYSLYKEHFTEDGVHISRDDNGNLSTGRMGDPLYFSNGQAFHWRVDYSSTVGSSLKANVNFPYSKWLSTWENNNYSENYASHGCVHTPHWLMEKYDSTHFQKGVLSHIADQPSK